MKTLLIATSLCLNVFLFVGVKKYYDETLKMRAEMDNFRPMNQIHITDRLGVYLKPEVGFVFVRDPQYYGWEYACAVFSTVPFENDCSCFVERVMK